LSSNCFSSVSLTNKENMLESENIVDHLAEEDEEKLIKIQTRTLNYIINELIDDRLEKLKRFEFVRITGQIMNVYAKQMKLLCFKCSLNESNRDESNCLFDKTSLPELFQKFILLAFYSYLSIILNPNLYLKPNDM